MEKEMVKVVNKMNHNIGVVVPELNFKRKWSPKMTQMIPKDILEQLLLDRGFKYMIDNAMLYIEDMEVKKELFLEPEDATEPVNIIVLSDEAKEEYLTKMSLVDFKNEIVKLPKEQVNGLVEYAIEHEIMNNSKSKILKNITGRDVIRAIQLNEANKEEDTKEG